MNKELTMASLLVVDDEEANRDLLSRRLERAGYRVRTAASAMEALEAIQTTPVDLVLLDVVMPEMNGLDLLRLCRSTYSSAQLPVIIVSALTESHHVVEALGVGANDFVTKPVDFPVALARIQSQLHRKRAEEALRESEQRHTLAALGANDGLWDWDMESGRVNYSHRWKSMLGYEGNEIGDSIEDWLRLIPQPDRELVQAALDEACADSGPAEFSREHRLRRKDGYHCWVVSRAAVLRDALGAAIRISGSTSDVTRAKAYDPLTGAGNRILFMDRLEQAFDRLRQDRRFGFAVIFLDMDGFKIVNDSLGHAVGDLLLVEVAQRLQSVVRNQPGGKVRRDLVARMGGDEFAIVLECVERVADAEAVADRILKELLKPFILESREMFASASIGIAVSRPDYQSPQEMIRDADTAMHHAKTQGRSRHVTFDDRMREQVMERLELENDLRRALDQDQLSLVYQPRVELETGRLIGFEALLRWNHPVRGLVLPGRFISLAEENGLIVPIGLWVLREACRALLRWQQRFPLEPPLDMGVNVSLRQFRDEGFVEKVAATIQETGVNPANLHLEITESVLMDGFDTTLVSLNRLRELGVGLKIDDFGTGYSSLNYLHRLPFTALKIDRSFVSEMSRDSTCLGVVETIASVARGLQMEIIGEGVETSEQAESLQAIGCKVGQGYYFARPMTPETAEAYIEEMVRRQKADSEVN
jgi:diguanylate cyclase (GGDEF)-like protein/PAS domain S-box-containing protein